MIKLSSIGSFFEEHVEKIVLAIVGLICAWLLITRVLLSPNMVAHQDSKHSPSAIDKVILEEAKELAQTLREPPEKLEAYEPRKGEFLAMLDSSITGVDIQAVAVAPRVASTEDAVGVYDLPRIGQVEDVAIGHIRAVAYVPIDEVTEQNTYDKAGNEPNDIDLVSVAANFDIAGLYTRFNENFVEYVEQRWADPCLAEPLFAAVQLQRQELNGNNTWSQWQDVPRARTDQYKKLFNVTENVEQLPAGGLKVRLLQYDYPMVQFGLLQPEPYQFATADEEWLPPELHKEYKQIKAKEALEARRQEREEQREERNRQRDSNVGGVGGMGGRAAGSGRRTQGARARGNQRGGGGGGDIYGMGGGMEYGGGGQSRGRSRGRGRSNSRTGMPGEMAGGRGRTSGRGGRSRTGGDAFGGDMMYGDMMEMGAGMGGVNSRFSPLNEVYTKYDEMMLTRLTELEKLEKLTFWAHDDTVEPRKTYRYRIRLGVFNPIAGTNKVSAKYQERKNDVILWSDFSEVTEPVEIMGKMYFFANNVREADKAVNVEVARLALGRWHSDDFWVRQGEVIGEPREPEPEEEDRNSRNRRAMNDPMGRMGTMGPMMGISRQQQTNVPEIIDYRTGAIMVDAVVVNDWSVKPLRSRNYFNLLYSYDGINIEHMPVGMSYRPQAVASVYSQINRLKRVPQEEFKSFGTSDRRNRRGGGMDGMYDEYGGDYMMEEMYMDPMGGGMGGRR